MDNVLEIRLSGWTATPRLPFVLSGNAVCMHTPTYSLVLGIIGCCLGRLVSANEVQLGFKYQFDAVANDLETRQRLEFDGKKVKQHAKGTDAYLREFHISPKLIIWINRVDWKKYFENPEGTPSLGRSQDILKIEAVSTVEVEKVDHGVLSGSLLPFQTGLEVGGQLVQVAESYGENDEVGSGRTPTSSKIFISIPHENNVDIHFHNLYRTKSSNSETFYLHDFNLNG